MSASEHSCLLAQHMAKLWGEILDDWHWGICVGHSCLLAQHMAKLWAEILDKK
jgi:hypothetical protein